MCICQETHTYVAGDWKTFNEIVELVRRHTGRGLRIAVSIAWLTLYLIIRTIGDLHPQVHGRN